MLQTAENVAKKHGIGTAEQHEVVLRREEQYREALANDAAFLKRFMTLPFDVPAPNFRKTAGTHRRATRASSHSTAGRPGEAEAGHADGGSGHLRRPDASGRRQRRDRRHHRREGARTVRATRRSPCACTASAWPAPRWPTCPRPRVPAAQRALEQAGAHDRADGGDQDAQPVRRQRPVLRQADRRRPEVDEQLRLLAGLGPPAGADGHALDHRS